MSPRTTSGQANVDVDIDPKPLNVALNHCNYPMPTIDDILLPAYVAKIYTLCPWQGIISTYDV